MKLFDKVKNLFTEEVEEEPVVKKEVRHIEVAPPTRAEREPIVEEVKEEPKKEEKFVFFSDDDFKDLEKPKREEPVIKEEVKSYRSSFNQVTEDKKPYNGATFSHVVDEKKPFKPSPIISPVYGVLDKNYSKDEVVTKPVVSRTYENKKISVDDIRNKAYGTVEDEIKDELLGNFKYEKEEETIINDIDIFEELDKYEELDKLEQRINESKENTIDDLFEELDSKKEEILDELDNKKDEILDELITKKEDIIIEDELDEETLELSRQLENQKRQLDELNDFIEDNEEIEETEELDLEESDELNESELFDLIDSMYEKKDDE